MVGPRRFWLSAAAMTILAGSLLAVGSKLWYDSSRLEAHGVAATAVIDDFHTTRYGTTVYVHFTPTGGAEVDAIVHDPPDSIALQAGSTLPVRYDPEDPTGRIQPLGADDEAWARWAVLGIGTLLMIAIGRAVVTRLRR